MHVQGVREMAQQWVKSLSEDMLRSLTGTGGKRAAHQFLQIGEVRSFELHFLYTRTDLRKCRRVREREQVKLVIGPA